MGLCGAGRIPIWVGVSDGMHPVSPSPKAEGVQERPSHDMCHFCEEGSAMGLCGTGRIPISPIPWKNSPPFEKLPPLFLDILKQGGEFFNRVILDILIQDLGYRRAAGARKFLRFKQADNDFLQCHQGIRVVQGPKIFRAPSARVTMTC